jgi:hypothetical protein
VWDLIAADAAAEEDAVFLAVLVQGGMARLLAGRGGAGSIRALAEDQRFPQDDGRILTILQDVCHAHVTPLQYPVATLDEWLLSDD